jgi:quinol monooxygenase YgiN
MKRKNFFSIVVMTMVLLSMTGTSRAQAPAAPFDVMEISHTVKDYATWKKGFDADELNRKGAGLEFIVLSRSIENPNSVTVVLQATDLAKAKAFAASPKLKEVMEKNGVISKPVISYFKVIRFNPDSKEKSWVVVTHKVKDFDTWLKVFDKEGTAARAAQGLIDVVLSRDIDDPSIVHLVFDIKDMAKAKASLFSEEKKKLMMSAGVVGPPKFEFFTQGE